MGSRGVTAIEYGLIVALIAVVIIVMVASVGGLLPDDTSEYTPVPARPTAPAVPPAQDVLIVILSPKQDTLVAGETVVTGALDAPPSFSNVWLFVVGPDHRYYPQWPTPGVWEVGGETLWEGTIELGMPTSVCTQMAIFAVAADAEADEALRAIVQQSPTVGHSQGLDDLPFGAKLHYDIVTVTRCP